MPILYESTDLLFSPALLDDLSFARTLAPDKYADALAEAERIEREKGIPMTVESLKPIHFRFSTYKLPVGDTMIALKENTAFYPVGIFSTDSTFEALKWYEGAKTRYLCDWMTKWVAELEEKRQIMWPQPVFKGGETFTFTVVKSEGGGTVDAWLIGYVVLPETMAEMPIRR